MVGNEVMGLGVLWELDAAFDLFRIMKWDHEITVREI